MENPKICDCPYTDWCHETRQWVNVMADYPKEECVFFKMIKEKENENANKTNR